MKRSAVHTRDAFVDGPSNTEATTAIDAWPAWTGGTLALVGPESAGKTHLAQAWAISVGAAVLPAVAPDLSAAARRPVLLEDIDQGVDEEALFHLINLAARGDLSLLLTARTLPGSWAAALPDLRSRLNALPVAQIAAPDDAVLHGVLKTFFRERNIRPHDDVYPYLLRRMERSIAGARTIVERLDETDDAEIRPVSRALARQILEADNQNLDLFE